MRRCCLIIVEDEALLRLLMEVSLEATDFDFKILSNVGAALQALEAEAEDFDVLVTNVDLGDARLTGFDLARRARALNPNIHVVYISGGASDRFETEKIPNSVFLPKPFEPDRLLDVLRGDCETDSEPAPE